MSTSVIDRVRAADPERHARRLAPAGAALCLLGAALANWGGALLALVGLALLLVSCLSRDDGLLVLGPFARYELVRASRRKRPPALWRALYAAAVLGLLGLVYANEQDRFGRRLQPGMVMEYVAVTFFTWFAVLQFLYLSFLTINLLAPLVAEERDAKRLDFLLASDLRNREILIGKAVGRLPQLLDPVLASLPILALLPFFGGVPPGFVIGAAVATIATVLALAGISFFQSVISPNAPMAAGATVGVCMGYIMLSGGLWLLAIKPVSWTFPTSVGVPSPVEVQDVVRAVSAGNPIAGAFQIGRSINAGADPETTILNGVRWYSVFQLGACAAFGLMAVARLRKADVRAAAAKRGVPAAGDPGPSKPKPVFVRPPVTDDSVTWYEHYRVTRYSKLPKPWVTCARFFGTGVAFVLLAHLAPLLQIRTNANTTAVIVGGIVWMLSIGVLMATAGLALECVTREREKDTLEALMLTGLGCREILRQKWRGCLLALRPLFVVLLGAMTAGLFTGKLHPLAFALVALIVPVHAVMATNFGLVFTVRAKSTARAGLSFTLALLLICVAGVIGMAGMVALFGSPSHRTEFPLAAVWLPPAATAGVLSAPHMWNQPRTADEALPLIGGAIAGTMLYAGVAVWLWGLALRRFEREWEGRP